MKNSRSDLEFVLGAAEFAARKHRDQRRKDQGASPYINHPITVADLLVKHGAVGDPRVIAAALLHDTIEDTETSYEELRGRFGATVADIVVEVTDVKWLQKHTRKRLHISRAARATHGAKLVKLADKIANLHDTIARPPAGWTVEKKREYFDWAKSVVDRMRGVNPRLERYFDRLYRLRP